MEVAAPRRGREEDCLRPSQRVRCGRRVFAAFTSAELGTAAARTRTWKPRKRASERALGGLFALDAFGLRAEERLRGKVADVPD